MKTSAMQFLLTVFTSLILFTGCQLQQNTDPYSILWGGDTLLDDSAQELLDEHGYGWPFEHLIPLIEADFAILNQEGPITTIPEPWDKDRRWSYNAQPESAEALAQVGFDAVSFANNHTYDRGPDGIADTIRFLQDAGIETFGAGMNQAQAEVPLIIETPHGKVGVVGLSYVPGEYYIAGEAKAGTIELSAESIQKGYELARSAGADWVVGYVHWGVNYHEVTDDQLSFAWDFARAGYDLVIGHGSHHEQPVIIIDGTPVVFSLGNFVFGSKGRFDEEFPGFGLIVTSYLNESGFEKLVFQCIQTDNDYVNYQPRPCTLEQSSIVLKKSHRDMIIEDGLGLLYW